jgi:HAD superfamily hydrolase (TIGR01509 family)
MEILVVDLGGVAARYRPDGRLSALSKLSGVEPDVIVERLFDSGFERAAEAGAHSADDVVGAIQRALDDRVPVAAIVEAWALAFEPDAEVLDYVASLPLPAALFTNNGPMLDACLASPLRALATPFREIICSWHLRARKPEALAFERAALRLGCPPDRLLLLDDSAENAEAAARCGWDAECVTGSEEVAAAIGRRLG